MIGYIDLLESMNACEEAVQYCRGQGSLKTAWDNCVVGEWLLWFAEELGVDKKIIGLAVCDCVERALKYVPKGETRPAEAIRVKRLWCRGEATDGELDAARAAVWAVPWAARAARAAAWAARAARAAAWAARPAMAAEQKIQADIIRKYITWDMIAAKLNEKTEGC